MIKTSQPVSVETKDERNVEQKIVFAEILEIKITRDSYVILIQEFVYDNINIENQLGETEIVKQKRPIVKIPRLRSKEQVLGLIDILKNETQLTAYGLTEYIGLYETLNQVERNDFVAKSAHLIENNRDLIRGVNWEKHTETA